MPRQQPVQPAAPPPVVIEKINVLPPAKPKGLGTLSDMGLSTRGAIVAGLVTVVICLALMLLTVQPEPAPPAWQPAPRPASTTWMHLTAQALAVVVALAVVALLLYGAGRLWISYRKHAAEAEAARIQARLVPRDTNGHAPAILSRDGDTLIDPDVAPAGIVHGLNSSRPAMPVPETDDHRRAADRAAIVRLATGAGSLANRVVDLLTPPPTGADMPPWLDLTDVPRETALLLEAAEEDFRRLALESNRE